MKILTKSFEIFATFLVLPLAILAFNIFLFYPWFSGEGPANLGSIEVSYVWMAKSLVQNQPHLSWAPVWYLGFPFHLFYTPVLPVLTALLNSFGQISLWHAYRILTGAGLVLAPVSLYFMILSITRHRLAALASGILYSVIPSIFYFILPSGEVRADTFSSSLPDPRRVVNLARWGEGPHIFSLIFLPLAGLFFFKAFKDRRPSSIVLAAFFTGLTALTNAVGLYALVLLIFSTFIVEGFFEKKNRGKTILVTILIGGLTYGLIAFWYNLTFISTFFSEGGGSLKNWLNMFPWGLATLTGGIFGLLFLLKKFIRDKAVSVIFLWTLTLFAIVYIYYNSAPPKLWQERIELAPQALRYMLEVDFGLAAMAGVLIAYLAKIVAGRSRLIGGIIEVVLSVVVVVLSLAYGLSSASSVWKAIGNQVDLEKTVEKKMADFLSSKVDSQKGERVFLAGNYAFYLNYFSDVWQLRGALYQAKTHPWPEHIYYQLRVGESPEIAKSWLEIINAKYVVVIPGSEYEVKDKFKVLPLSATLEDGSLVYSVPLSNDSPVKIVNLSSMAGLRTPQKGDDKEAIFAYDSWLKMLPDQQATFVKVNNDMYRIKARIGEGEGILVQITADGGWRAVSPGGEITIKKDPLGFFVLIPKKAGEWEITLTYGKTADMWLGYLITIATLGVITVFLLGKNKIHSDDRR